ncbi:hypothetical protein [Agrobacterium vitis]|uniref:Uncharacterized protein n=1 Tax=Agrobacterium vitis TaxID=373 RepID=A0AAE2RH69_AGRVI|nr:hypothetical protein [Agrobacterium vitis]MBF2717429.1 hypothetical protein [Agrobacterium vitis]
MTTNAAHAKNSAIDLPMKSVPQKNVKWRVRRTLAHALIRLYAWPTSTSIAECAELAVNETN